MLKIIESSPMSFPTTNSILRSKKTNLLSGVSPYTETDESEFIMEKTPEQHFPQDLKLKADMNPQVKQEGSNPNPRIDK